MPISNDDLVWLRRLSEACDPPPWTAWVERRDAVSGDSVIITGEQGKRGEDIYVTRDSGPAGAEYLDLIAAARTYLPRLIIEIEFLRNR